MPNLDFTHTSFSSLLGPGGMLSELTTPTLRLGVTGLARAGKTVFITALVRNLLREARLPFFLAAAQNRIERAFLEPQPDHDVPRFAYEDHLAALARNPPDWPESTRRISQLRVTIEYRSVHPLWRQLGTRRLHVDIVDYPGEWLIDLPLLTLGYGTWAATSLEAARRPERARTAGPLLAFLDTVSADQPQDEQLAIEGARLFTAYLTAERAAETFEPTLGPGRFMLPGELEGSPLLTFMPLDAGSGGTRRGTLGHMMAERYASYRKQVVEPFFRNHFARLDRQIVLVDALSALDRGPAALSDLEATLTALLSCFRTGAPGWLATFLPRRIDRLLLAATKADHVPATSHDRLEAILEGLTARAAERAGDTGAEVKALAIAALRATREGEIRRGEPRPVLIGRPLPGSRVGGIVYDGRTEAAIFPGDLPRTLEEARGMPSPGEDQQMTHVRFRPQRIAPDDAAGGAAPWPHIRLDRALEFLIGDYLA